MSGLALVFPGQGSQAVGMGAALHRDFDPARLAFEEASEAVGFDLASLCFEGPGEKLNQTRYTQPCLLAASVAAYRAMAAEIELTPVVAAGHSLGEYSALVAAGALSLSDAAKAVHLRGTWMDQAVPEGLGGMAAVLGAEREAIEQACREASTGDEAVAPANDNAPGQIVISGHAAAIERAIEIIKSRGGKARKLKVSGPFHTELMAPAAEKMAGLLESVSFLEPDFPVIANVDAKPYPGPDRAPERLVSQITTAVRWRESVIEMDRMGADVYIETGPGTVLTGLIKRTLSDARVLPMNQPGDMAGIKAELSNGG